MPEAPGNPRESATRPVRRRVVFFFVVAVVAFCAERAAAEDGARCAFTAGKLEITVRSEAGVDGVGSEVQITVADSERLIARLSTTLPGFLEQCWKTDLDRNGRFEIVIASASVVEGARVDVYEWRETRFEPVKIAPVDSAQLRAGAFPDRYSVVNDVLYARFRAGPRRQDGQPGNETTLRYSFEHRTWEAASAAPQNPPP